VSSAEFEAISPGLPSHQDEVMAAHQGAPSVSVQNVTHGAPAPEPDHGMSDREKYSR
jgi:hypothetical protein